MISAIIILFVLIVIACGVIYKLLFKYVLKDTDPFALSLVNQFVCALLFLPLAIGKFVIPSDQMAWVILGVAALLWAMVTVANYTSFKYTDVSLRDPVGQSRVIWALFLGIFLLRENPSWLRIVGTLVIFVGVSMPLWDPNRKLGNLKDPGIRWTLGAAVLIAIVAVVDKIALGYFSPETYGFLVYLLPGFILLAFLPGRKKHVAHLIKTKWKPAILAIILTAITYYFTLRAYAIADITLVYPLLQLGTLVTVLGAIIFLRERKHMALRIAAAVVIVVGTILIGF